MSAPNSELDSSDSESGGHRWATVGPMVIDMFAMDEEEEGTEQHNNSWSKEQINSNTEMMVLPGAELASHPSCVVCLVDFQAGEEVMKMRHCPCSQPFHKLCLVTWLRGRGYCPYCRGGRLVGEQDGDELVSDDEEDDEEEEDGEEEEDDEEKDDEEEDDEEEKYNEGDGEEDGAISLDHLLGHIMAYNK